MKVVLLAGGLGTRISEESEYKPKPMIEIGGMPILWHIMKCYSHYGYNDFIICAGYKQYMIKEWFADYYFYTSDVTFDFSGGADSIEYHDRKQEPWRVTVVDTGRETFTGGRVKRIQKYIGDEPFLMTYGDGVCDVNINDLVDFHNEHDKPVTITSVALKQTKGVLEIDDDNSVRSFREKKKRDESLINAGYMVVDPIVFDYIDGDNSVFEKDVLERLAKEGNLMSYRHDGFWQCMDTMLDKSRLERIYESGDIPWKKW